MVFQNSAHAEPKAQVLFSFPITPERVRAGAAAVECGLEKVWRRESLC